MRGAVALLALLAAQASAMGEPPDPKAAYAASQAAIGRTLGDHRLTDASGQALRLSQLRGKPVVLSLIYTSCYHVCTGLTLRLRDVTKVARDALGADSFTVLTVGFDVANDTPSRMRSYARGLRADMPGWHFASADAVTIQLLAREVGFVFSAAPQGFDHLTQTTLIDAQGRVVRQIYGDEFPVPQLVDPLKKLIWGGDLETLSFSALARTIKLFCTIYDPSSDRYRFDYSLITEIVAGVLAFGMVGIAIVMAARRVR